MAEYVGNTMPQATYKGDLEFNLNQELLWSTQGVTRKGVTLKAGQGVLLLGTALKKDSGTNYYVAADAAGDVEGFLQQTTDTGTDSTADAWQGNILFSGFLNFSLVSSANSFDVSGVTGAVVNDVRGYFRF